MEIKEYKNHKFNFKLGISFDIEESSFCLDIKEYSKDIKEVIEKIKNYKVPNGDFKEEEGKDNSYFIYGDKESKLFDQEKEKQIEALVQFYVGAIEIVKKAT